MIVSMETFNHYTGNYDDTADCVEIKEQCLASAEQLVRDYLRYDPVQKEYANMLMNGNGSRVLELPVANVTELIALKIDGAEQDINNFVIRPEGIRFADLRTVFPVGDENIVISYKAGYDKDSMPGIIVLSIMRIATLMLMEAGENIGVSGKSMPDNSRTFINYTNYRKYLAPLQDLRRVVF